MTHDSPFIAHEWAGLPVDKAPCLIVWGHGWAQNRQAFKPFTESLPQQASHLLIDFPGFGESPKPPDTWETADYADAVAELIKPYRAVKKIIWVGHSFGGRVGIQLAARHPELVDGLFLIASFGLPRRRSLAEKAVFWSRIYTFKTLKNLLLLLGRDVEPLRKKFGSSDYKAAGSMRPIFFNVIRENLSEQARQVKCPSFLVYGADDIDTPPDVGERFAKLIPNAELNVLPEQDHFTLLTTGRHLVLKRLVDFMRKLG